METLRKHKYIFVAGLGFIILVGTTVINNHSLNKAFLSLTPKAGSFIINEDLLVAVNVDAKSPIDAFESTINFPKDSIGVVDISKDNSIINQWIREPLFSNEEGTIKLAGIIHDGGFQGKGTIVTLIFRPKKLGRARIDFLDSKVLAHDGKGTDIFKEATGATYFIREKDLPSPDLNDDGSVGLSDVSILIFHWGKIDSDSTKYDLNQDGKIGLTDLSILIPMILSR